MSLEYFFVSKNCMEELVIDHRFFNLSFLNYQQLKLQKVLLVVPKPLMSKKRSLTLYKKYLLLF